MEIDENCILRIYNEKLICFFLKVTIFSFILSKWIRNRKYLLIIYIASKLPINLTKPDIKNILIIQEK